MSLAKPSQLGGSTVAQLYLTALNSFPDRIALHDEHSTLTYDEVKRRGNQVARLLRATGLNRQDCLAFLVGNRTQAVVALFAAQLLGLRAVSLHPMASQEDHLFVLKDANVRALIVDGARFEKRALSLKDQSVVEHILSLDDGALGEGLFTQAAAYDDTDFVPDCDPDEITRFSYTGGTTGRSKGILHPHRTVVTTTLYELATFEWPADIRFMATTPISHAAGAMILPTLLRGGTFFMLEKYEPHAFLAAVQKFRINSTFLVPTQIYGLLDFPTLSSYDYSSLELVLYGAAPIATTRLKEALTKIGPVFAQLYGQAEAPMALTYLRKSDHDLEREHLLQSCGMVVPGNQIKLLDHALNEVPVGEVGELCARGPLVMDGYLNRPEENEKVFAGGWLHTGDMARFDQQGYLYIVDRVKDMIITGGFNVYPTEVENCLAQHPSIAMSAVIGTPDIKWGETVTAIVVLKAGQRLSEQEVIDFVIQHKGVVNAPKIVKFESALPLTALGKTDKKALRTQFWQGQQRQVS